MFHTAPDGQCTPNGVIELFSGLKEGTICTVAFFIYSLLASDCVSIFGERLLLLTVSSMISRSSRIQMVFTEHDL